MRDIAIQSGSEGYDVDVAYSAEQALEMGVGKYQLILLDVMMGGMSGFKMAQMLKRDSATARIPIIFCTAKDNENDVVTGLNIGADDYITKPFSIREVCARVNTVLRRGSAQMADTQHECISFDNLTVDISKKRCTVNGNAVQLTKKEFEILALRFRTSIAFTRARRFSRKYGIATWWCSTAP